MPQLGQRYRNAIMIWGAAPPYGLLIVLHGMGMTQAAIKRKLKREPVLLPQFSRLTTLAGV